MFVWGKVGPKPYTLHPESLKPKPETAIEGRPRVAGWGGALMNEAPRGCCEEWQFEVRYPT